MNFHERKKQRIANMKYSFRMRLRTCTACNGSGHYDISRSPKCGACNGTGKELYYHPPKLHKLLENN